LSRSIDYEKVLNPPQLEAVMNLEGPLLVVAGAGSGKTRTLVYRVARLVETGVPPEGILLLTFTRKAAGEMLERAAGLVDENCRRVSGGTFHSLAHRVLRSHAHLLGFERTFTILDRSDMEMVIQSLVREIRVDREVERFPKKATIANILSKAANLKCSLPDLVMEEYAQFLGVLPQLEKIGKLYGEYKREHQLMDYDDLLLLLRRLLAEKEEVRRLLAGQYRYIMVDEYQDTNATQAEIIHWLGHEHRNVMVVGDDSQSIYSFRGADFKNMFSFAELFPEAKTIKLEENFRSTQPILNFTNALMEKAEERYTKCLFTRRKGGDLPRLVNTGTDPDQARYICRTIKEELARGRSLRDFAVLFRAAYHSFTLEMELARQGIPFVKYGGFKFMESAHIKDLLAFLRVLVNKQDVVSWQRVLKMVKNIGPGKSRAIVSWMKETDAHPSQVADWPKAGKREEGLKALAELFRSLSKEKLRPEEAVDRAIQYYDPILKDLFDDYPRRQRELEQLAIMAERYRSIRSFLDDIALEPPTSPADLSREKPGDVLTLSTVHSAKGLEWRVVFVIWVLDGYFPAARARSKVEALEEERRLMYVAATRARDQLILCYPAGEVSGFQSPFFGMNSGMPYRDRLSCFLQGLPEGVTRREKAGFQFHVSEPTPFSESPSKQGREMRGGSRLRPGDRVRHPAFGKGVVSKVQGGEKIEVLFGKVGKKLLHLSYTTLEKI